MNCNCHSEQQDPTAGWRESLESINLWTPFERLLGTRGSVSACIRAIEKSERASTLGLGNDFAALYSGNAAREDRQVIRQLNTAKSAFQDRTSQPDWATLSGQLSQVINEPETRQTLDDFRERWIQILLDAEIAGDESGQMLQIWDDASSSLISGGMDGLIQWTTGRIDFHLDRRPAPEYGRAPNSPLTVARAACIAAVVAATLAALIACAYIPFCWCCLAPLIAWGADEGTKACNRI